MDKNDKILKELDSLNKTMKDLLVFLLCREGYTQKQIRAIFGKMDNAKITKMSAGINNYSEIILKEMMDIKKILKESNKKK